MACSLSKRISALILLTINVAAASDVTAQRVAGRSISPVSASSVSVSGGLWADRLRVSREVTLPHVLAQCRTAGRIENFKIAGGLARGEQCGQYPFDDTDIYKLIEGESLTLASHPLGDGGNVLERFANPFRNS